MRTTAWRQVDLYAIKLMTTAKPKLQYCMAGHILHMLLRGQCWEVSKKSRQCSIVIKYLGIPKYPGSVIALKFSNFQYHTVKNW